MRNCRKIISFLLCAVLIVSCFSFLSIGAAAAEVLYGDADRSGEVNIKDATCIQRYVAKLIGDDDIDLVAAKVNGDENLSIRDATSVQKFIAEIIDSFPTENTPTVSMTFNVTIPEAVAEGGNLSIGTNFNSWNPGDPDWVMTKVDDLHYTLTMEFPEEYVGEEILYKYTVQLETQDNVWSQVEGGETGGEIDNRTYVVAAENNVVNDTVAMFKNQTGQNSVTGGTLETFKLDMPQYDDGRTRGIRVWIPDGYDAADTGKKYSVLYMHDGQNLFDSFTSFAGEWKIDEAISDMMSQGLEGTIVVGIDNDSDRINEYTPDWPGVDSETADNPSGDKYSAFIVETLMPYINSHYNVKTDKESTGVGGSSMGGLISYYMGLKYPDVFGQVLVFSPSFWLFGEQTLAGVIAEQDFSDAEGMPKMYLYAGGTGGEAEITPYIEFTRNTMISEGYLAEKLESTVDETKTHSESAWAQYFPQAYQWLTGFVAQPPEEKDFYRIYLDTTLSEWNAPVIAMWIGSTSIVPLTPVEGSEYLFYYDLPKEQEEFLFRANDDLTQWGEAASVNVTFRPANENMVYVLESQTADGKYQGSWQTLPEKDSYTVYFDVSTASWDEAYICMWIGGENFVKMSAVDGRPGVYSFDLPKEQTEFLLRADLDFSNWGEYSSVNVTSSADNEGMVYVFTSQAGDGKFAGEWQEIKQ